MRGWTAEELEAMARADEEIEAEFRLSREERLAAQARDRRAKLDASYGREAYRWAYYEANREEIAAYQRAYREANREEIAAYQRAYREANREEIAAKKRAYYEANREEIAAKKRAYYEANREEIAAKQRAYREAKKRKKSAGPEDRACCVRGTSGAGGNGSAVVSNIGQGVCAVKGEIR